VILVREILTLDDLPGIHVSTGFLASSGARTAHAAVISSPDAKSVLSTARSSNLI
jgi:phosphoenolpyruvate synthase/pyruvate phosphate dikinase